MFKIWKRKGGKKKKELELPRRGFEPRISRLMLSITVERIKPTMLSGGCEWVAGPDFDILTGLRTFTYTKTGINIYSGRFTLLVRHNLETALDMGGNQSMHSIN